MSEETLHPAVPPSGSEGYAPDHPLDNPPLILRRGPGRPLLLFVFGGFMAALGTLGFATGAIGLSGPGTVVVGLFTLTFGALAVLGLVALVSRPSLTLSRQGLVAKEIHRTRRWSWSEFERFEAAQFDGTRWAVSYVLAPTRTRRPGVHRKLTGVDGFVPHHIAPVHPRDLANLLNGSLARWR